jgi:hypothetical protein
MRRQLDARVTVELEPATKAALEELARSEDRSVSSLLRRQAERIVQERRVAAAASEAQ